MNALPVPVCVSLLVLAAATAGAEEKHQYASDGIAIPRARVDEPVRSEFSLAAATGYLDQGAKAWSRKRKCVSCHTNGSYLLMRPALTPQLGRPDEELRTFFIAELKELQDQGVEKARGGLKPTQLAYIAAGLAEWDRHVTNQLSAETRDALRLLFQVQSKDGSFANLDCWPPLESSSYHGATVAALAVAAAPGWLSQVDEQERAGQAKLLAYLQNTEPPHDYARVLRLWAGSHWPGVIDAAEKQRTMEMIRRLQNPDGGWAMRRFSTPEKWGRGNRAKKLRAEPAFDAPASDGHMTGLAVMVLRAAGVSKSDGAIKKAVSWLKKNQRESGRWWTRSLNTGGPHYITYSGTCYPLAALAACGELAPANR